jgi:hypothetical protein
VSKPVSHRMFTSWVRRGAAAAITEPDPASGQWSGPATFKPSFDLNKDGVFHSTIEGPTGQLTLLGPGAVTGLDRKAILRIDPPDGATAVEDNFLVQVEFSRADLPWMFTPAKANSNNRLRPWLVLIAVESSTVQIQPGVPLPRISVPVSELPDLNDSWGWAHSQVTVDAPPGEAAVENTAAITAAAAQLIPASGTSAISRLLCPRRLQPNTSYLACVVPATLLGRQAGLGLPPDTGPAIAQAWQISAGGEVLLPVYYSWQFSTGGDGDFKSLVKRLHGVRPTDVTGFGIRPVDMSNPWQGGDQLPPGSTVGLGGALGSGVEQALAEPAGTAFRSRLLNLLDFPAERQQSKEPDVDQLANVATDPAISAVAPPIYAGRHAGVTQVRPATGWLRTLNVDPRRRIAAAFGTQYVQENQEFLMAQAWNQLGAVQEANRLQALGELACEVGDRMHARHIAVLSDLSKLVSIAAPARTRIVVGDVTLHTTVTNSPMPAGAATVAFSRFTRLQGPLGRRTFNGVLPTVIEAGMSGTLKTRDFRLDGLTTPVALPPLLFTSPTAGMVSLASETVANLEKATAVPDLARLFVAVNVVARAPAPVVKTLRTGLLAVRSPIPTFAPKPIAVVRNLTVELKTSLTPSLGIFRRFQDRVRIPDEFGTDKTARVMACPQFTVPLAIAVKNAHPDWLLPGVGRFPDNCVTLVRADPAFVESFMAGANHEMNRELLWRGYPTDQRGTPFRFFWPRPDRAPDIPPITDWAPDTPLGKNGTKGGPDVENMVVLLVRGELLHRYPRLIVHAAPATRSGSTTTLNVDENSWTPPDFALRLDERTTAFAYNIGADAIRSGPANGGVYFVFSEPISGPRFNFDVTTTTPMTIWNDLDWGSVQDSRGFAIAGRAPLAEPFNKENANWNRDAGDIARIAFARPFRVAYHADKLLPSPDVPPGA